MSAFQCSRDHVALIAARFALAVTLHNRDSYPDTQYGCADATRASVVGTWFAEANALALDDRYNYPGDKPTEPVQIEITRQDLYLAARLAPGAVIKLVDCFTYQACDWSGWRGSQAAQACHDLIRWMALEADGMRAAWDAAPWGIGAFSEIPDDALIAVRDAG